MPVFAFEARTAAGRPQRGREEATSAAALTASLRSRGWLVLNVNAVEAAGGSLRFSPAYWIPPRSVDVELGLQQTAVMLRSGLTLLTALRTAAEQARRARMAVIWNGVADQIQLGSTLSDALARHRRFPHLAVQLARVGEQTGTLDAVLARSAEAMERKRLLRIQLFTALFYPAIVLIAALGVSALFVFYLIPKLMVFLTALGRKLP